MPKTTMGSLPLRLGLFLLSATSCGGSEPAMSNQTESNVVVNVGNVPARTAKLSLKATLNGQPSTNMVDLTSGFSQFGFTMPYSTMGRMTLDATSYDSDGCTQGNGQGAVDLPNALVEVPLPLAAQSPRKCGSLSPCGAGSVCSEPTKPTTQQLWGMFALSATDIWAVGANSTTIHYDGTSWTKVPVAPPYDTYYLNSVWASGPKDVWAVGETGIILHHDGTSWAEVSPTAAVNDLNGVWGFGPNDVWIVGSNEYCWHWNGTSWSSSTSPVGSTKLYSVWGAAPNDVYATGLSGLLLHYTGGTGSSAWATVSGLGTTADLRFIWGKSANQIFVVGTSGTILRYDGSWKRIMNSPTASTLYAVVGDNSGIYAVGNNGIFLQSTTAPYDVWTSNNSSISANLTALALGGNGIGWAVGAAGYLGHFDLRP